MSDLVEFLLARIAEDEAPVARDEAHESWCMAPERLETGNCFYCGHPEDPTKVVSVPRSARVLAECASKRRIVEEVTGGGECQGHPGSWLPHGDYREHGEGFCRDYDGNPVLRLLALPYAGHADYDEAWRP